MNYAELIKITFIASEKKPKFGESCNNCGWCCLTEVCPIGVSLSGSNNLPCKFMTSKDGKHFCCLAESDLIRKELAIGTHCDAKTQDEILESIYQ